MDINKLIDNIKKKISLNIPVESVVIEDKTFLHKKHKGYQKGKFHINKLTNSTIKWSGLKNLDLAEKVTTQKNYIWKGLKTWKKEYGYRKNNQNSFHVVAIDYGIKKNILRYFSDFKCKVTVVSCKTSAEKILALKPNGVFLSLSLIHI